MAFLFIEYLGNKKASIKLAFLWGLAYLIRMAATYYLYNHRAFFELF
ncbi:hypothetical protein AN392_03008 [Pseudoalteromonas sp. P1-16-1b]|nr:hypothetical protein AN392_03008 [Pseudoalteromonas sp. P1-16-1b]